MFTTALVLEFTKLIFYVGSVAIASGFITSALTQLLKWKAISIPATKYPTIVAAVLSLVVSLVAVLSTGIVELVGWYSYAVIAIASLFVAVQSYDVVHNAIKQLKSTDI